LPCVRQYTNPANAAPHDVDVLSSARSTIDFAAYALVDPTVIEACRLAVTAGATLRLYLDRTELEAEAHHDDTGTKLPIHPLLALPGVQVKVKHSTILMHLKSYQVDNKIVRSGSANFSTLGEGSQDNEASWDDDTEKIAEFKSKFEQMWSRSDNLTIAQAIDLNRAEGVVPTHQHSH
jgi:phosphatidylserine/phosphatidylglycerophosphate/cardiolipin synthase-like enzyme